MVQPRSTEDDDLLPDLPRADGGVEGEENFQPKDDSDLGLGEESELGLDGEAGPLDESLDGELDNLEDEPASWLDDGKEPSALVDDDASELDADDENLTEGSEPASDQAEDWDEDFGFDDPSGAEGDGGEEGFGDESLISSLELDQLPPLDDSTAHEEEPIEADPFAADALAELGLGDEELGEQIAPGLRGTRIDRARVAVHALLRTGRPLARLIAVGAGAVAWDGGALLVAEANATRRAAFG